MTRPPSRRVPSAPQRKPGLAATAPAASPFGLVKAIFTHHLRVKHGDHGLRLVFEAEAAPAAAGAPANSDAPALQMHADLHATLDATPGARRVLRHLAGIEHQLKLRGSLFIHDLSLAVLQNSLRQLDGVLSPRPAKGLALLRERLCDAIGVQERLARAQEMRQPPSSFFVDYKLEVAEATPSDFLAVAGQPPAPPETDAPP